MPKRQGNLEVIVEKGEDGYFIASVPALPGCHTQAKSIDVLTRRTNEAIRLYKDVAGILDKNSAERLRKAKCGLDRRLRRSLRKASSRFP
jgi:predicted RNase H-like HicB family nuclease